jgi:hypothetical protein
MTDTARDISGGDTYSIQSYRTEHTSTEALRPEGVLQLANLASGSAIRLVT